MIFLELKIVKMAINHQIFNYFLQLFLNLLLYTKQLMYLKLKLFLAMVISNVCQNCGKIYKTDTIFGLSANIYKLLKGRIKPKTI